MFYLQCHMLKPLREISVFFEGEKYPTLCGVSRLITTLNSTLHSEGPPPSWNLGILALFTNYIFSCNVTDVLVLCMHNMYMYTIVSQSTCTSHLQVFRNGKSSLQKYMSRCFLSLKTGFKTRFNPSSLLLNVAALVHPGHKSLS